MKHDVAVTPMDTVRSPPKLRLYNTGRCLNSFTPNLTFHHRLLPWKLIPRHKRRCRCNSNGHGPIVPQSSPVCHLSMPQQLYVKSDISPYAVSIPRHKTRCCRNAYEKGQNSTRLQIMVNGPALNMSVPIVSFPQKLLPWQRIPCNKTRYCYNSYENCQKVLKLHMCANSPAVKTSTGQF